MNILEFAACSDQGPVRDNNEDYLLSHLPEDPSTRLRLGGLFVLADGVGGQLAGEVAAREASCRLREVYFASSAPPARALKEGFEKANLHVCDLGLKPGMRRMQTTLAAVALCRDEAHLGFVGDTRIYLVRDGGIKQLSRDHSEVFELVRLQIITSQEARSHPRRNILTRSVGSELMLQADFRVERVFAGDVFILCTDGLWEPVDDLSMAEIVTKNEPAAACRQLVALAIENGTTDNVSVHVIKVKEASGTEGPAKSGLFAKMFRGLTSKSGGAG